MIAAGKMGRMRALLDVRNISMAASLRGEPAAFLVPQQ